ncbi:plasmid maintenance system killer [Leptospira perolatii]|uniref:Plasmid maintenance system killer n=1 Tax=Leptospira perolatii TaxID=2023191 RepID=A0A2M9ZNE9_9LEPT|nr:type II toxin-antitoxin system RelE/ParE family toxin [Leptospira perolatii]PJZ68908.1 plasmid maintenance system killer [Leptospira perolatii]PJZ73473.1 plasmid maintenance system killer [Leptospira perolatii]
MILSFSDKECEIIWQGKFSKKFPKDIQRTARRKLIHLDSAKTLEDLKIPPGNRLHALSGDRRGQHSISINMQYRICFIWENGNVTNVEIVDYH